MTSYSHLKIVNTGIELQNMRKQNQFDRLDTYEEGKSGFEEIKEDHIAIHINQTKKDDGDTNLHQEGDDE